MVQPQFQSANWRTIPIGSEWNKMFWSFKTSAYRLETLQAYAEPSESGPFNRYLRGDIPDSTFMADWCAMVQGHITEGRTMRRVHVVDLPLSDYMRFETECCYRYSGRAGEDIRFIDRRKLSAELLEITQEDFWLFDGSMVMVNDYDRLGTLYQARICTDPEIARYYGSVDTKTWDLSISFREFYKDYAGIEL